MLQNRLCETLLQKIKVKWHDSVNRDTSIRGSGGNKLRKYKLCKHIFETEEYCKCILSKSHRSAFAKFRAGVPPIRIELGRYEGLSVQERKCPFCRIDVEDEFHVLFHCPLYSDIRQELYHKSSVENAEFLTLDDENKFQFIFVNRKMIRICAKTCYLILQRRNMFMCR